MVSRQEFGRIDRVRKAMIREVSSIIATELQDPRLEGRIVSVTDVEMTNDLRYAKIFVSVLGDEPSKEAVMEALLEKTPQVRSQVGRRIRLRYTPEVHFFMDDSLERGDRVSELLKQIAREDR
ncbi:MAG: 30S ribosome-binding factor RbfA [Cyanobacteria bacterium]|nr:30S ribosome-binding factor RbfA [Cyanobacteriota bacterium]